LITRTWRPFEVLLEIGGQNLGGQPALREHDDLEPPLQELGGETTGLSEIRSTYAQLLVDNRRIHEQEPLLATWCAAFRHQLERLLDERLRKLAWIRNRGR
jgi:hypothetical protein